MPIAWEIVRYAAQLGNLHNDSCLEAVSHTSFWSPTLISMADQPPSNAAKKSKQKGGGIAKLFRDVIRRPKSANDSASQSNLTRVSFPPTVGAHDPVAENDAGSSEPTVASKYIGSSLLLSTTTWLLSR